MDLPNLRYGTFSNYIPAEKTGREIFVRKGSIKSIEYLRDRLNDDKYYSSNRIERKDLRTGEIIETCTIEDEFESDIICGDCYDQDEFFNMSCAKPKATANPKPFAIICPRCKTNFMDLIRNLE